MENANNSHIINSLKHLLYICNDGKEGYASASENVDAAELKALLTTYSIQRSAFAAELKTAIREEGGDPDNSDGGPLGALHRAWINLKTVFTTNDNKAVIEACITGEKAALKAYDELLSDPSQLSPKTAQLLKVHRAGISDSLSHIEILEHQYIV